MVVEDSFVIENKGVVLTGASLLSDPGGVAGKELAAGSSVHVTGAWGNVVAEVIDVAQGGGFSGGSVVSILLNIDERPGLYNWSEVFVL